MGESFDIEPQRRADAEYIFSIQFLENGSFACVIEAAGDSQMKG